MRRYSAALAMLLAACSKEGGRVLEARDEFYGAVSRYDHAAIRSAVGDGYLAVDRGRIFGVDSLISDVTLLEQEGASVRYAFRDSTVRVEPPVAWAVYRSQRIVGREQALDTAYAIETATFQRVGSGWKLLALHRTPIAGAVFFGGDTTTVAAPPPPPPAPPQRSVPARVPVPAPEPAPAQPQP